MDEIKVKNIFAAVSDKLILDPLLEIFDANSVKFWGTEGTTSYLKSKGFGAQSVVSGFDFDGRVKSLDKKVFAAILADRSKKTHLDELKKLGVEPIDAVVVNLYPLDKNSFPGSMDIGGQALVRAAIKNYKNVAVAFDEESIKELTEELKSDHSSTFEFRKTQAKKAVKFIAERSKSEIDYLKNL